MQAQNSFGTTNATAWTFNLILSTPVANYLAQPPTTGSNKLDFSIGYSDPNVSINTSTFDSNDVTVTGPNGYSQNATFISQSQPGNAPQRSATYEIAAPNNGVWDATMDGTYTVTLNANQVANTSGVYAAAGTLGTFTVNANFAYINNGGQLVINTFSPNLAVSLSQSGSLWTLNNGSSTLQFNSTGFTGVDFIGTSGNDSLSISSALTVPLSLNGGSGKDTLNLSAGTLDFASDVSTTTSALTMNIFNNAQANFSSNQHLSALNLANNADVASWRAAGIVVETQTLSISDSAYIDVADDALVVNLGNAAAISSYVANGSNDGAWNGPGINSHVAAAQFGNSVGVSPASSLSYNSIDGVSFSTRAVVVRYTYDGDANLDGTVNADDLSLLMLAAVQQQQAVSNNQTPPVVYWYNGDFNYDSQINSDDFMLLSLGSAVQNQQTLA